MTFNITPISIILFIATALNIVTTSIGWRRRKTRGGMYFFFGMMGITLWTLAAGLDYAAVPSNEKIHFAQVEYIGYNSALAFFTVFVIAFTGYEEWLKKLWVKALFILIPAVNILLALTNELHSWIWRGTRVNEFNENILIFEHGPGFTWVAATGYLMVLIIIVLLWLTSRRGSELTRRQARLLLIATMFPIIFNVIYLLEIPQINGIDFTSIAFTVSGLIFLAALYGAQFLELVPVARHTMVEWMVDSVLLLDGRDRVLDFNRSAREIFGINPDQVGKPIRDVLPNLSGKIDPALLSSNITTEISLMEGDRLRVFDVRLTPLSDDRGEIYGKLIVFRDITSHYEVEQALKQRLVEIQELHENLQQIQEQMVAQQRELARIEERQLVARDLHDSVSQSIHSLVLFSETLTDTLEKNNIERARKIVRQVQESAQQTHKELRLLLYELKDPGMERSVNLVRDLEERLTIVERHTGVRAEVIREGALEHIPPEWHENLYWIAIEALNNILKHARARSIKIILHCSPQRVEMEVSDNGRGFDTSRALTGGQGWENMKARAEFLGGTLTIESEIAKGTCVRFSGEIKTERL